MGCDSMCRYVRNIIQRHIPLDPPAGRTRSTEVETCAPAISTTSLICVTAPHRCAIQLKLQLTCEHCCGPTYRACI